NEPIREGLVGSLGPMVDTLLMCSCTAMVIIASGVWLEAEGLQGVQLTLRAFGDELGVVGQSLLALLVLVFCLTTVFTFWYYGDKCFSYLVGAERSHYYRYFYLFAAFLGAVVSVKLVFNFLVGMYALMAIPTLTATLLLAPKVKVAAVEYFDRLERL